MSLTEKIASKIRELTAGNKELAGLDIGLSAIKLAVVAKDGENFVLKKYCQVSLPEGAIIEDDIQKPEEITQALVEAANDLEISPLSCTIGISGPNTVVKKLQLAGGSDEEVAEQVDWEAEQYLPFEIEESVVAHHKIGENEGGGVDVIVGAAKNNVISEFGDIVKSAGGKVKIVDLSIIAVANVFEHVQREKLKDNDNSFLVLDFGAQKTFFIIYKSGMINFTKEINVGGVMITEEIQRQMGVNYSDAEALKITGDENGNLPEEILEISESIVETFFAEIKKAIDFYVSSTSDESMQECFVTGGNSLVPGILEGLEALLGIEVSVLNPFDAISYAEDNFSEEEINQIAYQGVQAIGLGMRRE